MKNLKTFAKANETLTTKAMKTVQGGDINISIKSDSDAKLKELSFKEGYLA